jgi:hypothetical protein
MKLHTLIFTEPSGFSGLNDDSIFFTITNKMYQQLLEKPKEYVITKELTNKIFHNAYIFGAIYPLEEYEYLGEHTNSYASTGLIDYNLFEAGKYIDYKCNMPNEPEIFYLGYNYENLVKAREKYPALVFYGYTLGGDVGAALYIHYKNNLIDGILIDNQYFFDTNGNIKKNLY